MPDEKAMPAALRNFAKDVKVKISSPTKGEDEDQLRAPFETLMNQVGSVVGPKVICIGETLLEGHLGKPDYAIHANDALVGYVELKATGKGANPNKFKGHDRRQWDRFQSIPNLIYTDGNDWALIRDGQSDRTVRLAGDITAEGQKAVSADNARRLLDLLTDFFSWHPIIPSFANGKINIRAFSKMLAPLCRMLRGDVTDAMHDENSPLVSLAADWRQLLFPEATDTQFADSYAQTVTFALLLARSEGADPLTLPHAEQALGHGHSLLSRALKVFADPQVYDEISASLNPASPHYRRSPAACTQG